MVLVLAGLGGSLEGQSVAEQLGTGDRIWVRTRLPDGTLNAEVKGILTGVVGDSLFIRPPGTWAFGEVVVAGPKDEILVYQGRSNRAGAAAIGLAAGVGAGVLLGIATGQDCGRGAWLCFDRGDMATGFAMLFGLTFGALGAAIGTESWKALGAPDAPRPVVMPKAQGVGVGLSLSF